MRQSWSAYSGAVSGPLPDTRRCFLAHLGRVDSRRFSISTADLSLTEYCQAYRCSGNYPLMSCWQVTADVK